MSNGFVPGVFWGVVVSATCLVIASQSDKVVDLSPEPMVEASDADGTAMEGSESERVSDAGPEGGEETEPAQSEEGAAEEVAEEAPADDSKAEADEVTDMQAGDGTEEAVETPEPDAGEEDGAEEAPDAGTDTDAGAEESRDVAPPSDPEDSAGTDVASDVAEDESVATPGDTATVDGESEEAIVAAAETDSAEDAPVVADAEPAGDPTPVVQTDTAEAAPADTGTVPDQAAATEVAEDAEAEPDTPPVIVLDAPNTLREPDGGIGDLAENVTTNRLPRIGDTEEVAETPVEPATDTPAIERNAVPFEAEPGVPLLSVVLVDDPSLRPTVDKFADFPMPLTIAVDPLQPDAAKVAEIYRAAGHEVAVLTPLADGALPGDVAESFEVFLSAVPQAVAVMDLPQALLQANRARATQVSTILQRSGHGLITYDRGFNSGVQIAEGDGVPAKLVFRVFDNGTQNLEAMRQVLDNSVLGAGQQGAAILVGRAREESLQALAEWVLGTRGASVSPAPVSAALKR